MGNTRGKKPPAPSIGKRSAPPNIKAQIADEIYTALQRLGVDEELLSIIGSWRDTLNDEEVLQLLEDYNAIGGALHRPQ